MRYGFSFGDDWAVVDGIETGLSQIARKAPGFDQSVVWNFPIDISFKSTNAHGWPRVSARGPRPAAVPRATPRRTEPRPRR